MALTLKQGDRLPALSAQMRSASGPIDLTGATVVLRWRLDDGTVRTVPLTVSDAVNGRVTYAWQAGDTDTAGVFPAEFVATYGNGAVLTIPNSTTLFFTILEPQS